MKLYSWEPNGHGSESVMVVAEDEATATKLANEHVTEQIKTYPYSSAYYGWGTGYFTLIVTEPHVVTTHENG